MKQRTVYFRRDGPLVVIKNPQRARLTYAHIPRYEKEWLVTPDIFEAVRAENPEVQWAEEEAGKLGL